MAGKIINTRILVKYDTYDNWVTNDPVLLPGEFALATIDTGTTQEVNSVAAPQVLIKVGDGEHTYTNLPFASGRAVDVYSWAKADKKPTYEASEITGISDYIAEYVQDEMGISIDTDTQYQIIKGSDDYNYKLQSKGKGDSAWADVSTITIPKYDDTAVKNDISALKNLVGNTAVATQIANAITALNLATTYEAKGEAAKVQTALDTYKTSNNAVIDAIKDGAEIDSFKDVEDALAEKQAAGDYELKSDADALRELVGEKSVATQITEAVDAITASDIECNSKSGATETVQSIITFLLTQASSLVQNTNTLIGNDGDKSVREIANEELAAQLIAENADASLDTLTEIAAWIQSHPDDASAMNEAITAIQNQLSGINAGNGTVKKYIDDAISALKIGDYAKAADLTALANKVTTAELNIVNLQKTAHEHGNKALLDTYDQTNANIKDAVDKAHVHSNKTALDKVTDAKIAAWDKVSEKANDADLAAIAKTGSTDDLAQGTMTLIFNCGNSSNCGAYAETMELVNQLTEEMNGAN